MTTDPVRGSVVFEGCEIAYWVVGPAGAPWLAVCHGAGLDHESFLPLAAQLADRWRVLLWDMPGHGRSGPMPRRFSADLCARALATVMTAAGADRAIILGFSYGGVVGQIFAKQNPDKVAGFIAYGCFSPHLMKPHVAPGLAPTLVRAHFALSSWPAIRQRFGALCCLSENGQAAVERAVARVGRAGFLRVAAANLAASDYDPDFRIHGPILLLIGREDSNGAPLWRTFRAFEQAYPEAPAIVIPDAGHCAHMDQPEAFNAAVSGFLDSARSP